MTGLLIVEPMRGLTISTSRGSGVQNLLSIDPKEVWADTAVGSLARITVDLGAVRTIDTVCLGYVSPASPEATWVIRGGLESANGLILGTSPLRVPDVAGDAPAMSHALWTGAPRAVRYVSLGVTQPSDAAPLTAGVLVIGKALSTDLGREWGWGRQPIDTGTATGLPSGGFAVVEGARKILLSWTFGDLSVDETDQLERLALDLGTTSPGLVIEDADRTAGLRSRIHYGLFRAWRAFERRNARQTRWEMSIEQWV